MMKHIVDTDLGQQPSIVSVYGTKHECEIDMLNGLLKVSTAAGRGACKLCRSRSARS